MVRTTGLVVSEASVIAERANLFAEVIVYAQRFVASNNATHSRDESHNRWLCPLRSISANASACFSLCLRSAAQRAGANKRSAVCRQNVVLFQVRCRMKKDNPFGLSFFGAARHLISEPDVVQFISDRKTVFVPSLYLNVNVILSSYR